MGTEKKSPNSIFLPQNCRWAIRIYSHPITLDAQHLSQYPFTIHLGQIVAILKLRALCHQQKSTENSEYSSVLGLGLYQLVHI